MRAFCSLGSLAAQSDALRIYIYIYMCVYIYIYIKVSLLCNCQVSWIKCPRMFRVLMSLWRPAVLSASEGRYVGHMLLEDFQDWVAEIQRQERPAVDKKDLC